MRFEPELALSPPVNQSAVTFAPNRKTRDSEELELISFFLVRTAGLEPAQGYHPQGILSLYLSHFVAFRDRSGRYGYPQYYLNF
jgi:hypothetical protein